MKRKYQLLAGRKTQKNNMKNSVFTEAKNQIKDIAWFISNL